MPDVFTYRRGAALPGLTLPWQTETGDNVWSDLDLSTGYSFTLELVNEAGTTVVTKTTGITGAVGSVAVSWSTTDLDVALGLYTVRLRATENATSKARDYSPGEPVRINIV